MRWLPPPGRSASSAQMSFFHGDLDEVSVEVGRPLWAWSGASRTSSTVRCLLSRIRAARARHMQRTPRPASSPQSPRRPRRPWPGVAHEVAVGLPARARAPHKCRGAACTSRPLPPRMQPALLPPCLLTHCAALLAMPAGRLSDGDLDGDLKLNSSLPRSRRLRIGTSASVTLHHISTREVRGLP